MPSFNATDSRLADVNIVRRPLQRPPSVSNDDPAYARIEDGHFLEWRSVGAFAIRGSSKIEIDARQDMIGLVPLPLMGAVMALLLHARGLLVLHASAVEVGGRAFVFIGDKGAGKSTTAATMIAAGARLISDDVVALDFSDVDNPVVLPAYPEIKLNPDAAAAIALANGRVMPSPHPEFSKVLKRIDGSYHDRPTPLGKIYTLTRSSAPKITPLNSSAALSALLQHSYALRFGTEALGALAPTHFSRCADLASQGAVAAAHVPATLHGLAGAVALIASDKR